MKSLRLRSTKLLVLASRRIIPISGSKQFDHSIRDYTLVTSSLSRDLKPQEGKTKLPHAQIKPESDKWLNLK